MKNKLPQTSTFGLLPIGTVFRGPGKDQTPYRKVQTHQRSNQFVNATKARSGDPEYKRFDFDDLVVLIPG